MNVRVNMLPSVRISKFLADSGNGASCPHSRVVAIMEALSKALIPTFAIVDMVMIPNPTKRGIRTTWQSEYGFFIFQSIQTLKDQGRATRILRRLFTFVTTPWNRRLGAGGHSNVVQCCFPTSLAAPLNSVDWNSMSRNPSNSNRLFKSL